MDLTFLSTVSQDLFAESQGTSIDDSWMPNPLVNSELSLFLDLPTKPVSWRAKVYDDLNFVPQCTLTELPPISSEVSFYLIEWFFTRLITNLKNRNLFTGHISVVYYDERIS